MVNSINTIRTLAIEAIEKANSGHPGICMGSAPMAYSIFNQNLKATPMNPDWINRDRFILSAGHGSALLYSVLHLTGYDVTIEDLKSFRQLGSKTPGHPESFDTKGVDVTTGPLGQGFATSVGIAMAERYLSAKLNKPNYDIIDHYTYVLCGDGDLMEGISYEATSLAGHLGLDKLIVLYDSNDISLDGELNFSFSEDVQARFKAQNWDVMLVEDGEDIAAIDTAIKKAKTTDKPTLIEVKTTIGFGANKKAGTSAAHGAPLGEEELSYAKRSYGLEGESFSVTDEVYADFKENFNARGEKAYAEWTELVEAYKTEYQEEAKILDRLLNKEKVEVEMQAVTDEIATRVASHKAINQIANQDELFIGGSADLSCSNNTTINSDKKFILDGDTERNIYFGVREFAMGAIANGVAIHSSLNTFVSTFMVFSDYLKPAIRIASLVGLPVTYVFTHDSVMVGEDGPTHQPIEQIAMFRSLPNLNLIRPADANETQAAWKIAHESTKTPTVLSLTRQNLELISDADLNVTYENVKKGAYVVYNPENFTKTIVATGSEVKLSIDAAKELEKDGIIARVVSMPSQELFDAQSNGYKHSIIPVDTETYAVEMLSPFGWEKYTKDSKRVFGLNRFGLSAPGAQVLEKLGYTVENLVKFIKEN